MKKKISVIIILMLLLMTTVFGAFSYATEVEDEDEAVTTSLDEETTTEDEETTDEEESSTAYDYVITYDDLYVFETEDYTMDELIDGNAYLFVSGDVTVTGEINGCCFIVSSGTVEIAEGAYIADALYVVANTVKVDATIYDIYALCSNFETMENAYISRDVRVMASDVVLRGIIYRNVWLDANSISVEDDEGSLLMAGDFNYTSTEEVEGLEDAVLYGEINFTQKTVQEAETVTVTDVIKEYVLDAVTALVYVLIVYAVLKLLAPKFVENIGTDLKEKGIVDFAVGLLTWVIGIIVFVLSFALLMSGVGSPIAVLIWIAIVTVVYISTAVVAIAILDIVKEKEEKVKNDKWVKLGVLLLITLCIWVLQVLPYIGVLIKCIIMTVGLGLIVRNIVDRKKLLKEKTTETSEQ